MSEFESEVKKAERELVLVSEFTTTDDERQLYVKNFYQQMRELVEAALSNGKPITF